LNDTDIAVVYLNSDDAEWRGLFSLQELRKKLKLDDILLGKVTKLVYSDRYLNKLNKKKILEYPIILAGLLQYGLDPNCQVEIKTIVDEHRSLKKPGEDQNFVTAQKENLQLISKPKKINKDNRQKSQEEQELEKQELISTQKEDLELALKLLNINKDKLTVQVFESNRYIPHGRYLEIHWQDGQKYKVIFDKGMDFLKSEKPGEYSLKEPTYVVIMKTA
jgi:hypothetical protein